MNVGDLLGRREWEIPGDVEHGVDRSRRPWGRGHRSPPRGAAAETSARHSRRDFGTGERCGGACGSPSAGPRGRRVRRVARALPTTQTSDTSGTRWRTSTTRTTSARPPTSRYTLLSPYTNFEAGPSPAVTMAEIDTRAGYVRPRRGSSPRPGTTRASRLRSGGFFRNRSLETRRGGHASAGRRPRAGRGIPRPVPRPDTWWSRAGLNRQPPRCERGALPIELRPHAMREIAGPQTVSPRQVAVKLTGRAAPRWGTLSP